MSHQPSELMAAVLSPWHNDDDGDNDDEMEGDISDAESLTSDLSTDDYADNLDSDFSDAISNVNSLGHFTFLRTLPDPPPGGIYIEGVGDIDMPLEEEQARQIIAQLSDDEELGSSNDGVDMWEIGSTQFILDDTIWRIITQDLLKQVARHFGTAITIRAEPCSIILMNTGISYTEMTIVTESFAGKIGTLAIFLPSVHQGGEGVVKHQGKDKVVFTPNQTAQSFACWYSGFSSTPIESGYLWVLTYSLFIEDFLVEPSTSQLGVNSLKLKVPRLETRQIRHTLRRWINKDAQSRGQRAIYYPFRKQYDGNPGFYNHFIVKNDAVRIRLLQRMSYKLPFETFFARVKKKEETNDGHDQGSDTNADVDPNQHITALFDTEGYEITENHFLDGDDIGKCLLGSTDGNLAVVIIPRDSTISFFFGRDERGRAYSADGAPALFGSYARACLKQPPRPGSVIMFNQICMLMFDSTAEHKSLIKPALNIGHICDILRALLVVERYTDFNRLITNYEGRLPLSFFRGVREWLNSGLCDKEYKSIEIGLTKAVLAYSQPFHQHKAVDAVVGLFSEISIWRPHNTDGLHWARQVLKASIEADGPRLLTSKDGQSLARACLYFDDPFLILSQAKNKIDPESQPAAFLGFLNQLGIYGRYQYLPRARMTSFYLDAAKCLIASKAFLRMRVYSGSCYDNDYTSDEDNVMNDSQDTDSWHSDNNSDLYFERRCSAHREGHDESDGPSFRNLLKEKHIRWRDFRDFVSEIIALSSKEDNIFELFVSKLVDIAPKILCPEFESIWLPLLHTFAPNMASTITRRPKHYRSPLYRTFFSTILHAYLNAYVGQFPQRSSFARSGVGCSCPDCKGLNVFLGNRSLKVGRFTADQLRCRHLVERMSAAHIDVDSKIRTTGTGQTLVVTKTQSHVIHRRRLWKNRRQRAAKWMAVFGREQLAVLLGPEWMTFYSMAHLGGDGLSHKEMMEFLEIPDERYAYIDDSESDGMHDH
ncbi:2og-feii oxygenase superfamily [Trichoderma arundinaceum]|uniref:2og-feii oxygenase superfamily n=1 Tax=Trichoderma arundinaceum TaxID=490622 RepID=A0A395NI02_TRIAR|nr:2og-feii oxygenase superfamily [Trichoderma arundinaceum]